MRKDKLNEVTTDFITSGIFTYLATAAGSLPWTRTAADLNAEYYGNRSGEKKIAPLLAYYLKTDNTEALSAARMSQLAAIIWGRYGVNWQRQFAVMQLQYDPIENYSMTETEEVSATDTGTVADTESSTDTNTATGSTNSQIDIYGYDIQDPTQPSPSDKQTGSSSNQATGTRTGQKQRTNNLAHGEDRTLTRSGNIGTTTSQMMIESELQLWEHDFFAKVYKDIDTVLTIPVYPC